MSTLTWTLTRIVAPLGIIGAGLGCAGVLVSMSADAESAPPAEISRPVDVIVASSREVDALVQTTGTVEPARSVVLAPEVAGRITAVADALRPGGRFAEGEVLLRVDARDYQAALAAEEARLAQAKLELALEEKRQLTAEREWELLGRDDVDNALALRRPQLEVARRNLASAEAAVERARLNVRRTTLRAPFNAVVVAENAEVGQVVSSATPNLVSLVGADAVRVNVSVPVEKLSALEIPGFNAEQGSLTRVLQRRSPGPDVIHEGRVTGVSGQLDAQTRTATLLVTVDNAMEGVEPLLPGSFVDLEIVGRPLPSTIPLPRAALASGDEVWIVEEGHLARREVTVGWKLSDEVYVTSGIEAGDQVVVSPLSMPIEGMSVDVRRSMDDAGGGQ
jgi:RND family efflux transporter MFP subunit